MSIEQQPSSLSLAYARRRSSEHDRLKTAICGIMGEEKPQFTVDEIETRVHEMATVFDRILQSRDQPLVAVAIWDAYRLRTATQGTVDFISQNQDLLPDTTEAGKIGMARGLNESLYDQFEKPVTMGDFLVQTFEAAGGLAREKGVVVESIFSDDDLYAEYVRKTTTPDRLFNSIVQPADRITEEGLLTALGSGVSLLDPASRAAFESLSAKEQDLMMAELLNSSEIRLGVSAIRTNLQRSFRTLASSEVKRVWGNDVRLA